ncbi:MAG: hypothetical protein JXR88_05545 [Clostridia bacterium]|nr:hypothetical protein [Clostridia bacterium]
MKIYFKLRELLDNTRGELGIGTIVSIALAIIVAGFVLIPGLRGFAESVMQSMIDWWNNTIKTGIFPSA